MNDDQTLAFAERVLEFAWADLPAAHRNLLESIGADRWDLATQPLGTYASDLLHSAGYPRLSAVDRRRRDGALGLWIPQLRVMLINATHRDFEGLDRGTREYVLAQIAWHEWGHALGIARSTPDDVAAGRRLLELAPVPMAEGIRSAGYGRNEYTHEIVAGTYALLMLRRRQGETAKPAWLATEIYELVRRVVEWNE